MRLVRGVKRLFPLVVILADDASMRVGKAPPVGEHFRERICHGAGEAIGEALVQLELERMIRGVGIWRCYHRDALILRERAQSLCDGSARAVEVRKTGERLPD